MEKHGSTFGVSVEERFIENYGGEREDQKDLFDIFGHVSRSSTSPSSLHVSAGGKDIIA